jgi:hypothetical protein
MVRCLLTHKWDRKIFDRSAFYYRTCKRCGKMQRGIYDTWETMRERTYIKSQQIRIVRHPSSQLDHLAHTLGLRRSRASDGERPGKRSELIQS